MCHLPRVLLRIYRGIGGHARSEQLQRSTWVRHVVPNASGTPCGISCIDGRTVGLQRVGLGGSTVGRERVKARHRVLLIRHVGQATRTIAGQIVPHGSDGDTPGTIGGGGVSDNAGGQCEQTVIVDTSTLSADLCKT